MKRSEAYVGQHVWCGNKDVPDAWTQGIIVTLDCGDNGYRVGVAEERWPGTSKAQWMYRAWPLHSVYDAATATAKREASKARAEAEARLDVEAREDLEWMREAVAELEVRIGVRIELAPNFRTREHRAVLSKDGLAAVLGAVRRGQPPF